MQDCYTWPVKVGMLLPDSVAGAHGVAAFALWLMQGGRMLIEL